MRDESLFKAELDLILSRFPGKTVLSVTDVAKYTGKSRDWCRTHLKVTGEGCTAVQLARKLTAL